MTASSNPTSRGPGSGAGPAARPPGHGPAARPQGPGPAFRPSGNDPTVRPSTVFSRVTVVAPRTRIDVALPS
ncbi:MAG: hypothetical protein ACRD0P_34765, partial [Stackebrandtia sp.]